MLPVVSIKSTINKCMSRKQTITKNIKNTFCQTESVEVFYR